MKITHAIIKDGIIFGIPEGTKVPEKPNDKNWSYTWKEYKADLQALLSVSIKWEDQDKIHELVQKYRVDSGLIMTRLNPPDGIYPLEGVNGDVIEQYRYNKGWKWYDGYPSIALPDYEYRSVLRLIPQPNSEQKKKPITIDDLSEGDKRILEFRKKSMKAFNESEARGEGLDPCEKCDGAGCGACDGRGYVVIKVDTKMPSRSDFTSDSDYSNAMTIHLATSAKNKVGVDGKKEPETILNLGMRPNYKGGVSEEEPTQLSAYLKREAKGHTEFRLVVLENGTAYIHVLGRDSETLNFSI